jgi:hypothetical protein
MRPDKLPLAGRLFGNAKGLSIGRLKRYGKNTTIKILSGLAIEKGLR